MRQHGSGLLLRTRRWSSLGGEALFRYVSAGIKGAAIAAVLVCGGIWIFADVKTVPHWLWDGDISTQQTMCMSYAVFRGAPVRYPLGMKNTLIDRIPFHYQYAPLYWGDTGYVLPRPYHAVMTHNFITPYIIALSIALNHGIVSPAAGRFLVGFLQVFFTLIAFYFIAKKFNFGWLLTAVVCLSALYNPWAMLYGKFITGESFVYFAVMAFNCYIVHVLLDSSVRYARTRLIATVAVMAYIGALTEYFFWVGALVLFLAVLFAMIVAKPLRYRAQAIAIGLMAGVIAALATLTVQYYILFQQNWIVDFLPETGRGPWSITWAFRFISAGWKEMFPSAVFVACCAITAILSVASYFIKRSRNEPVFSLYQKNVAVPKIALVFFLIGAQAVVWYIMFYAQTEVGTHQWSLLSYFIELPFILLAVMLYFNVPILGRLGHAVLIVAMLYLLVPRIMHCHPAAWGKYPPEKDLLDCARLTWNLSHGHHDRSIRFYPAFKKLYIDQGFYNAMKRKEGSIESWKKLVMTCMYFGTQWLGYTILPQHSAAGGSMTIVDTGADPMTCLATVDGTQYTIRVVSRDGKQEGVHPRPIEMTVVSKPLNPIEYFLDSSLTRSTVIDWHESAPQSSR